MPCERDRAAANITIYARWTTVTYSVNFNTNGGPAIPPQRVAAGGKVTQPPDPVKTGFAFAGWYKDAALTTVWNFESDTVTWNTILRAKWTLNTYTVSFNSNGGTAVAAQTVACGGKVTKPADPLRTGCTFADWYKEAAFYTAWDLDTETVTADITLWAKWTLNAINLTDSTYSGSGVSYSGGVFTIANGAEVTVSGSTTGSRIAVSGTATIILDGASIDMSGAGAAPAIYAIGANLTLVLTGSSTVSALSIGGGAWESDSGNVSIMGGTGEAWSHTGLAVGYGAGGSFGAFTGPEGKHVWPEGGIYTW